MANIGAALDRLLAVTITICSRWMFMATTQLRYTDTALMHALHVSVQTFRASAGLAGIPTSSGRGRIGASWSAPPSA